MRQGCAISPLLFVLCLEPLACRIRSEKSIIGLSLPGKTECVKQTIFADDYTGILTTNLGMTSFMNIVQLFCKASGSSLNLIKSNGFFVGKWKSRSDHPFGISWPDAIKLLGVKYGHNLHMDDIWHPVLTKFIKVLNFWRMRRLTLKQKSIVLVSSACSKIWYIGSIFHMSKHYLNQFERAIFKFLWPKSGYEPLSRRTHYLHFKDGGLSIPHIGAKLMSLRIKHLIHFISGSEHNWCSFANYWCGLPLRKFEPTLWSNLCPHTAKPSPYYSQALKALFKLIELCPDFDLSNATVKPIYNILVKPFTKQPRCIKLFPGHNFKQIFSNLHNSFIDPAARDISFKLIMQILPVIHLLSVKYKLVPSANDKCTLCDKPFETYEHLFYYCPIVIPLRSILKTFLQHFDVVLKFDMVYLLDIKHKNKFVHSLLLFLCTQYIKVIWVNRNFVQYDKKTITSDSLILYYINQIKLRLKCDFSRFSTTKFGNYWLTNDLFCSVSDDKLSIALDV